MKRKPYQFKPRQVDEMPELDPSRLNDVAVTGILGDDYLWHVDSKGNLWDVGEYVDGTFYKEPSLLCGLPLP